MSEKQKQPNPTNIPPEPPISDEKPVEKKAINKTRTPRWYHVFDPTTGETVVNDLPDENACRKWIAESGKFDVPYVIGYTVTLTIPVTKTSKIILK